MGRGRGDRAAAELERLHDLGWLAPVQAYGEYDRLFEIRQGRRPGLRPARIGQTCRDDLQGFVNLMRAHPGERGSMRAVALLPDELLAPGENGDVDRLRESAEHMLSMRDPALVRPWDLAFGFPVAGPDFEIHLASLLSRLGFGLEPDPRVVRGAERLCVFRLPPGPARRMRLGAIAAGVAAATALVVRASRRSLGAVSSVWLGVGVAAGLDLLDLARGEARLLWLLGTRRSLRHPRLARRLTPMRAERVGAVLIDGAAGADASPGVLEALARAFDWLGLGAGAAYRALHERAVSGAGGRRTRASEDDGLDPVVLSQLVAETARVEAVLTPLFNSEAEERAPAPVAPAEGQWQVLGVLSERTSWTRAEVEDLLVGIGLLPEAALEELNAAAWADWGGPVVWGDDPVEVDVLKAKEMTREP